MPQMTIDQALELAESHQQAGHLAQAEGICRQVLQADPRNVVAMHLMAAIALHGGNPELAEQWIRRAIELSADSAPLHCTLGQILAAADRIDDAIVALQQAVRIQPEYPEALHDLAVALMHVKRVDDAISLYRRAISLRPDWAIAHHDLGLALLMKGDLREGFLEYDWRFRAPELGRLSQKFDVPRWDGSDLAGRTVLIHAEQGFGDTLQFSRFLPLLSQRRGTAIFQCQPELHELFQTSFPHLQIIPRGQPLPAFDLHISLLSLPAIFQATIETIPNEIPYLKVSQEWINRFRNRAIPTADLDIGLVWSSGSEQRVNSSRKRSIPLAEFLPLLRTEGIRWNSLQKGDSQKQMWDLPSDTNLLRGGDEPTTFADSAGRMSSLDLIITVDTAAAHLAGALGRPVWALVPYVPDPRWMLDRSDSPWYPSMRIFRQPAPNDWQTPIREIADGLRTYSP